MKRNPRMPRPPIRASALLFDMDGTLLLSHAVVERVWRRWANLHGLDHDQVIAASHGRRTIDTVRDFCPPGLSPEVESARLEQQEREDTVGIVPVNGVLIFLQLLPSNCWAIVTSADRALADIRLKAAGIVPPSVLITAEDVARGKPDPEGYLEAARRLGVMPADTVVFEDAPAGIAVGQASGARVVVLATNPNREPLSDEDWLEDFTSLSIQTEQDGSLLIS